MPFASPKVHFRAGGAFQADLMQRVLEYFADPVQRSQLFTAWFYHKYNESQSQWPYVHNVAFYVRKDVAGLLWNYAPDMSGQPGVEDEYSKKTVQLSAARTIGSAGVGNGQFNYPRNVAFDSQGNMYVVDSDNNRIQKFDASGKFLTLWGTKSPDNNPSPPAGTFNQPWGIAVDSSGNVYVADTWNHRIQKFDSNGKFITMWGSMADTRGVANGLLQQFLVSTSERFRLRIYIIGRSFGLATRYLLRSTERIVKNEPEAEKEWRQIETVRHDFQTLTEESLESLRVLLTSLGAEHREPEPARHGRRPLRVRRRAMRPVEARVDLDGVEACCVAFQVRAVGRERDRGCARQAPAGGADADRDLQVRTGRDG